MPTRRRTATIADKQHRAIDFLLEAGADPDLANSEGITARNLAMQTLARAIRSI